MVALETQQLYYTRPVIEQNQPEVDSAQIERFYESRGVRQFLAEITTPYIDNSIALVNGSSKTITDLDPSDRQAFDNALKRVVYERTSDLFSFDGAKPTLHPENDKEWNNIRQIAPRIASILLDEKHYVEAVSQDTAVNVARLAIDIARRPELMEQTLLNVGFGGSDSPYTSTRLEALAIPPLKIARAFKEFYSARETTATIRTRRNKLFDDMVATHIQDFGQPPGKEERSTFNAFAKNAEIDELPDLAESEVVKMKEDYAIPNHLSTIRFFFAGEAASGINHTMDPEGIRIRTDESRAALGDFVITAFSDVAESVEIIEDVSWEKHSRATQLMIEYCAKLLRESSDQDIQKTLQRLEKQGGQHGGDNGKEKAAEYAAIHPFIFQEALDLPFAHFLSGVNKPPLVNITFGGRPEKQFNHLREYLSRTVSIDGFATFVGEKTAQAQEVMDVSELQRIHHGLMAWKIKVDTLRKGYSPQAPYASIARPDTPFITIRANVMVADSPPYYLTPFDRPRGVNIEGQLEELRSSDEDIDQLMIQLESDKEPATLRAELKNVKDGVIFDLEAILEERKRYQPEVA